MYSVIEGGKTENISAKDLAGLGFAAVAYPITLVAAKLRSIQQALDDLKRSMLEGAPPVILPFGEVCEKVGFASYWALEGRYKYDEQNGTAAEARNGTLNGTQNGIH